MSEFKWSESYETGNEVVDRHHRRLMARVKEMETLIDEGGGPEVLDACHKLRVQVKVHFADEEDLLKAAGFPRLDDHIVSHDKTQEEINQVISNCGEVCISGGSSACIKELGIILLDHFVRGDLDFKSHLQIKNLAKDNLEGG